MKNPFSGLFRGRVIHPVETISSIAELTEMAMIHERLDAFIEAAMKREMDPNLANSINEYGADEGAGYFGREFELRATVGRLKSLYSREPWIYAGSTLIARTLTSVPMRIYDKRTGAVIPNHPLELLYKTGSPLEDGISAQWSSDLDLDLTGNAFLVLDPTMRTYVHVPVELCTMKLADPKIDNRIGLQTLVVTDPTKQNGSKQEVPYKQIIHLRLPNPSNKFYGMSAWCAAARPILLDRYKSEYDMAFYLRGATHTGVIETTEDMTKSRMERLMRTFEAAFTGRRNWWRPLFLPRGAKWISSSPTMAEMQHLEGLRENRKVILAVRGVPGAMVGLVEDANRANMETQARIFWENTIVPMAVFKAACWNNSYLARVIYPMVEMRPDFTGIESLQGSLISRGEQAKAVENHWKLDEIRTKIYGLPPMGDERGDKLFVEIKPAAPAAIPTGQTGLPASATPLMDAVAGGTPPSSLPPSSAPQETIPAEPVAPPPAETPPAETPPAKGKRTVNLRVKDEVTTSQNRIEEKLSEAVDVAYAAFIDQTLSVAQRAVADHRDVRRALNESEQHRVASYWQAVKSSMDKALDRGFLASQANVRCLPIAVGTKEIKYEWTELDRQAVEILRERTVDGQRRLMAERALQRFFGHSVRVTEQINTLVDQGFEQGLSWSEIARTIRDNYTETYPNQANTIVRTEILSAVSQGWKWNQEALTTIFDKVDKQWLHQGDAATNPDAREWHADFEDLGVVDAEYEFASGLAFPRDPRAEAGEIINCRCSAVSVIAGDATSHAATIIDSEF